MMKRFKRMTPEEYNQFIGILITGFWFLAWTWFLTALLMLTNSIVLVGLLPGTSWEWVLSSNSFFIVHLVLMMIVSSLIVWVGYMIYHRNIYQAPVSYWWVVAFGHPLTYEQIIGNRARYLSNGELTKYLSSKEVGLYYDFTKHMGSGNLVYFADKNDALRLVLDKPHEQ